MSEIQLYVIAFIATVFVWLVNFLAKKKVYLARGWLTTGLYAVSAGLAFVWGGVVFPAFPPFVDAVSFIPALATYITGLLTLLGPVVALATLIYNVLLKKVLDGAADKVERFVQLSKAKG